MAAQLFIGSSTLLSSLESCDNLVLPVNHVDKSSPPLVTIPRVLHYVWPNKNFSYGDDDPHGHEQQRTLALVKMIQANNPDWEIKIWTDDECYALVRTQFPDFYNEWIRLSPRLKMWDAIRPIILYVHGGIYLDHDIDCDEGVHFSNWIGPETRLLLREPSPRAMRRVGNHFMGSAPQHSIWKIYIKNIINEIPQNFTVGRHTGPRQLFPTLQEYIVGLNEAERCRVRLLGLHELDTEGECEIAAEYEDYCSQPRCSHTHSVSPAELAGEDDNPEKQVNKFKDRQAIDTENLRVLSIQKFLDCSMDESPCCYFYPTSFFERSSLGLLQSKQQAKRQLYGSPNRTLHANWVRFMLPPSLDWTYIHVRKAGGNTMYEFAKLIARSKTHMRVEIMPSVPVHQHVQNIGNRAFIAQMKEMANVTTFFTFIRDPISRFVSAMGQVADKKRNALGAVDCLRPDNPTSEMMCVLQHLKRGQLVNDHFTPASIELFQMMFGLRDKRVAVFPLESMNEFIKLWGMTPFRQNEANTGVKMKYSTDVLTEDMIRDICKVYEPVVHMMRLLEMSVSQCDAFIPTRQVAEQ